MNQDSKYTEVTIGGCIKVFDLDSVKLSFEKHALEFKTTKRAITRQVHVSTRNCCEKCDKNLYNIIKGVFKVPIYEYKCTGCGKTKEVIQKCFDEPLFKCGYCSGKLQKLISQSTFHLKGTGWYVTDYANK